MAWFESSWWGSLFRMISCSMDVLLFIICGNIMMYEDACVYFWRWEDNFIKEISLHRSFAQLFPWWLRSKILIVLKKQECFVKFKIDGYEYVYNTTWILVALVCRLYGYGLYILYPTDMSAYLLEYCVDSLYYTYSPFKLYFFWILHAIFLNLSNYGIAPIL